MRRNTIVPTGFAVMMAGIVLAGVASGWATADLVVGPPDTKDAPTTMTTAEVTTTVASLRTPPLAECRVLSPPNADLTGAVTTTLGTTWPQFVAGSNKALVGALAKKFTADPQFSQAELDPSPGRRGLFVLAAEDRAAWSKDLAERANDLVIFYQFKIEPRMASTDYPAVSLAFDDRLISTAADLEGQQTLFEDLVNGGTAGCSPS
ncbi:MAG: hypothetical protein QOF60_3161 [Actinomycetota bacterium]|jgi:hypothetical protein|nr:hypothetical protein [Actinomycetota bacterium]MEA3078253.1 hypothetical protein [Actinomycetota bacterium]